MQKGYVITDKTDICNISEYISEIKGVPANSASPTDLWIVKFKKDTYYKNRKVENGFFKLFINPDSIKVVRDKQYLDFLYGHY